MRILKRILLIALLLAATLPTVSCRRAVERAREKIRIEAVEPVRRMGFSGAELIVLVENGTRYRLSLREARFDLFYAGRRVVTFLLHGEVEVPRRTTERVVTRWKMNVSDPLAYLALSGRLRAGDISRVAVSCEIVGRGGPARVNISHEMMPLSDFLNIFGLKFQDLKNYLE